MIETDREAVAMANVRTVIQASVVMRVFDGGVITTFGTTTFCGSLPESFLTTERKIVQTRAEDKRVKQKPKMRMERILGRSAEGSGGARGNMTRLGTKKTESQRVRKVTPGVNKVVIDLSTVVEKLKKRRREMREKKRSMAARGAGKERECAARRRETRYWTDRRAPRESVVVRKVRRRERGEVVGVGVGVD